MRKTWFEHTDCTSAEAEELMAQYHHFDEAALLKLTKMRSQQRSRNS